MQKLDARQERHNSGGRQGFQAKSRQRGEPSSKPPPKAVKKWAVTPEALATMTVAESEAVTQEHETEDSSELQGIDFSEEH